VNAGLLLFVNPFFCQVETNFNILSIQAYSSLAKGGSTVVDPMLHHPKVEGSSPTSAPMEKMEKSIVQQANSFFFVTKFSKNRISNTKPILVIVILILRDTLLILVLYLALIHNALVMQDDTYKKSFILYINTKNKMKLVFKFYNNDILLCF
jgi:hypothetical protein